MSRAAADRSSSPFSRASQHPDVVEGLFKFAGTVSRSPLSSSSLERELIVRFLHRSQVAARFPVSLLAPPTEVLNAMMQLSVVGLGLQERYSIQAVTGFLVRSFALSLSQTISLSLPAYSPLCS